MSCQFALLVVQSHPYILIDGLAHNLLVLFALCRRLVANPQDRTPSMSTDLVVVWENSRFVPISGWGRPGPADRPQWSTESGEPAPSTADAKLADNRVWTSAWTVRVRACLPYMGMLLSLSVAPCRLGSIIVFRSIFGADERGD